jgi:aminoglycoside 3-N-acetyltransferase
VINRVQRVLRRFRRKLHRLGNFRIERALRSFGSINSDTLFVHSSLSACGFVGGGPRTVIEALLDWLGQKNLLLPTHTYSYPDELGKCQVFDPRLTRSLVGTITEYFWRQPGVVRSLHPTHSLAAVGPAKEALCANHEFCATPCGAGTPYQRLIERDAAVLMFGANMNTYTLFHTAEDAGVVPYLYESKPYELFAKAPSGATIKVPMRRHDMRIPRRFEEMALWLAERRLLMRRPLGLGELMFIPSSAAVHRLIMDEFKRDPFFLVAPVARREVMQRFSKDETLS